MEKDYSHRDIVDKLGIKIGFVIAFDETGGLVEVALRQRILERTGLPFARDDEPIDVVLATITAESEPVTVLKQWKARLKAAGGIWLLTPKRGQMGYFDQNELIEAGKLAGVVDNKICSVSDTVSAMRFVIRKTARKA